MSLRPEDPVSMVPFIGNNYAKRLKKLEIGTVGDLIHHYPFRYEDYSSKARICNMHLGQRVTVSGTITDITNIYARNGKRITKAHLSDGSDSILLIWFNQPYLTRAIKPGTSLNIAGTVGYFSNKPAFISPDFEIITEGKRMEPVHTGRLVPVYPETSGITSKWLRSRINTALKLLGKVDDPLPKFIRSENNLIDLDQAIRTLHFPQNLTDSETAKKRLGFDEIFKTSLKGLIRRAQIDSKKPLITPKKDDIYPLINRLVSSFPFKLTPSQSSAINEVISDLTKNSPMNRLLQGDVGSGKTVVALAAALAIIKSGGRVIYMAPTEILATQHYDTFKKYLEPFGAGVSLVTASQNKNFSESNILVGTHALIFRQINFSDGGLVIIDEQHKFGVAERSKVVSRLRRGAYSPHLLTMTATPIPRTLALIFLGDLDISALTEKPLGRKRVKTWYVPARKREAAYRWIKEQVVNCGSQVMVICPLIEESSAESLKSVKSAKLEYEKIKKALPELRIGLIHGQLKSSEKQKVLAEFRTKKFNLLVSTPVVEVGIDIPDVTIILIEGSERFGLSSLHQLRGRVGRSDKQSYCFLFSQTENTETIERLKILEKTDSGLEIASADLKRRGSGDLYGTLQSGLVGFKIADVNDKSTSEAAVKSSRLLIKKPEYGRDLSRLKKYLGTESVEFELN